MKRTIRSFLSKFVARVQSDVDTTGDNLIRVFKKAIENNHKKEHSTTFYAKDLRITPDHLNRIFKAKTEETAKER